MEGSFIARITRPHTFKSWAAPYGVSYGFPGSHATFDSVLLGNLVCDTRKMINVVRDFRYQLRDEIDDDYYNSAMVH
jgi:hypothetical protein